MQRVGGDSVRGGLILQHGSREASQKIADARDDKTAKRRSDDDDGSSGVPARVVNEWHGNGTKAQ